MAEKNEKIVDIKNEIKTEEKIEGKEEVVAADILTILLKDYATNILVLIENQKILNALHSNLGTIDKKKFKTIFDTYFDNSKKIFKTLIDNMLIQKEAIEKMRKQYLDLKKLRFDKGN